MGIFFHKRFIEVECPFEINAVTVPNVTMSDGP